MSSVELCRNAIWHVDRRALEREGRSPSFEQTALMKLFIASPCFCLSVLSLGDDMAHLECRLAEAAESGITAAMRRTALRAEGLVVRPSRVSRCAPVKNVCSSATSLHWLRPSHKLASPSNSPSHASGVSTA